MVAINDGTAAPDNVTPVGAGRRKTIAARASSKSKSLRLARKSAALPITLSLVVMTVRGDEPMISTLLLSEQPFGGTLPRGAFDPSQHQTLDDAARAIADNTTDLALGFVEQLITRLVSDTLATMTIEVCYLALLPPPSERKPRQMQKQNNSVLVAECLCLFAMGRLAARSAGHHRWLVTATPSGVGTQRRANATACRPQPHRQRSSSAHTFCLWR